MKFELLMLHNNNMKISEKSKKQNLLKICLQVIYFTDVRIICIHFTTGKMEISDFLLKDKNKNIQVMRR